MRVEEIMSKPAITCRSTDSLNKAAELMWHYDCGVIPVVDHDNRLVGIVTDRDVCMAAYTQGRLLSVIPVSTAMATQVFSCGPGDAIESVERLMKEKQVRRIPVVDGQNAPIGLVSLNDLVRGAAIAEQGNGTQREVVEMLSGICSPRQQALAAQ